MLIEFQVTNYRSLRDEQTLSMVASSTDDTFVEQNTMESHINAAPLLLCSAAIYGTNAAGKSNLFKALQYMRGVVLESASVMQPQQAFSIQPFLLDDDTVNKPTSFEISFIIDRIRYQYGFSLTPQRVVNEYLMVYKTRKPQEWFHRYLDPKTQEDRYNFGGGFSGQKELWKRATRPNSLFLSMAVQLNSEQLKPIYDWFANQLMIYNDVNPLNAWSSISMLRNDQEKNKICDFLISADIRLTDISVETKKVKAKTVNFDMLGDKTEILNEEKEVYELYVHHSTDKGSSTFSLNQESIGTQRLLFLTGPVLQALSQGSVLVIDEFESSLHPLLAKRLIELFHSEKNTKGAQLIFTTHNTSLLNKNIFRRDQVWFIDKNSEEASKLYPLTDFSPRKEDIFESRYLSGRYGAVPFFDNETL